MSPSGPSARTTGQTQPFTPLPKAPDGAADSATAQRPEVDDPAELPGDASTPCDDRLGELEAAYRAQERRLQGMLTIAANLGRSRDPSKAMRAIVAEISDLLDADRTTIYEYRKDEGMLWGLAVQGASSIEVGVPAGRGIAGLVATRGRAINLKDAYLHPAFDPKFDKLTGYRTRSMLCVPMRNPDRKVIGVVQVLNKRQGYFTVRDERLLEALAAQAAITLEALKLQMQLNVTNAELHSTSDDLRQKVHELELLHGIEQAISDAESVGDLVESLLRRVARVARAEAVAVFLPAGVGVGPLRYFVDGETTIRMVRRAEMGDGLLGRAAQADSAVIHRGDQAEADEPPPAPIAQGEALVVRDAVIAPLMDRERSIGVLALINRRTLDRREDADDIRLAALLAAPLARGIAHIRARRSAQVHDRLVTIGQMLSGVLHDLRGPMSIISGYSQMMAETDDPNTRDEMASAIRRQVNHFNDMVREVMGFVRGDRELLLRKVHLNRFVDQAREIIEPELKDRGITLEIANDVKGSHVLDEAKMLRVVANIARNAGQALGDHGRFTWRISMDDETLVFDLEDDGPGIPESIREDLFEMFTTSGKPQGTGLGLAIVKRIVDDHGGHIDVSTETGQGTRFVIRLPPGEA